MREDEQQGNDFGAHGVGPAVGRAVQPEAQVASQVERVTDSSHAARKLPVWPVAIITTLAALLVGLGIGYVTWGLESEKQPSASAAATASPTLMTTMTTAPTVAMNDPADLYGAVSDNCYGHVLQLLRQVPSALRDGYNQVSLDQFVVEYGYQSPEYQAASYLQSTLINEIQMNGDPETQLEGVVNQIKSTCARFDR